MKIKTKLVDLSKGAEAELRGDTDINVCGISIPKGTRVIVETTRGATTVAISIGDIVITMPKEAAEKILIVEIARTYDLRPILSQKKANRHD